jgi:hypothetical protein
MDIQGKTVLVLGGWGLVGNAIIRKIIKKNPKRIIVTSLKKSEAEEACEAFRKEYPHLPAGYFIPWWGNIFVRHEFKDLDRYEILNDPKKREILLSDIMDELNEDILRASSLYKLLIEYMPEILIDAINSATGIAYQDVYTSYRNIKKLIASNPDKEQVIAATEQLLCTLYVPQLIRHIQVLYNSMIEAGTKIYVKIGTSGTGGMGLNIPYTHSEERPSRVLLSKSSVAGAHTLLLFLMGRTPEAPIIKEIKPTAAIAWKRIDYGEIRKRGKAIEILDVPFDSPFKLEGKLTLNIGEKFNKTGETLKSVFIDTGENGTFSRGEFEAITSQGQMEYVTPQEIADDVIFEIQGGNTGHDIINALDNATLEPTYRAGFLQHFAVEKLEELERIHNVDSVAFELLGPPRLSKLLYEIHLIKMIAKDMKNIPDFSAEELSEKMLEIIKSNDTLRNQMLSIGIPVLLPDGENLLRGNEIKIPPFRGENELEITPENVELWAKDGWVDLRVENIEKWKNRIKAIIEEAESIPEDDTSSMYVRNKRYWNNFEGVDIGKVVSWIFINEEHGGRMKD